VTPSLRARAVAAGVGVVPDRVVALRGLRGAARLYAGGRELSDPMLSPIHGGLEQLGAVQTWVGTRELFLAQCCRFADLAAAAPGTQVQLRIGHGLIHDWPMFPIPEAQRTMGEVLAFLGGA
jgi:acetyl esterase/lipase